MIEQTDNKGTLVFVKEVAKYFMDFLETDFHKRKNPKRSIQFHTNNNLLIGLALEKYESFISLIWKTINAGFEKNALTIEKGSYRTNIPRNLLDVVKLQISKFTSKQINKIVNDIADEIERCSVLYQREFDKALNYSNDAALKLIRTELVLPFIETLEKPIENLKIGDENNIYLMEEELSKILATLLNGKITEVVKLIIGKGKANVASELKTVFELQDVSNTILTFFESYQVGDLFAELFEIERNKSILDKVEFYLYFCDVSFNKEKYPIFYIPLSIERHSDAFKVEFDSQLYINKKALEFITQEYNREKNKKGNLSSCGERIIYLAQHKDTLQILINNILSELVNYFELDKKIYTNSTAPQISKSQHVRISNSCYIALFDKSDEALVNDYEDILRLVDSGNNVIAGAFNKLINDFIHTNPQPFNPEVEDEWDSAETSDKLVFQSPIPLNAEQRQILSAVRRDGCKYVTVEGPPGTGKSHTITAILFDFILKDKSVLVLSDKKEALDVVEDKISETMNKVRQDKNFQNPILRLGKTGNTYSQILSTTVIDRIKAHYRAVKKDYETIEEYIEKMSNTLIEDIQTEILTYASINVDDIKQHSMLESEFDKSGLSSEVDELSKIQGSATDISFIRTKIIESKPLLLELMTQGSAKAEILTLLECFVNSSSTLKSLSNQIKAIKIISAGLDSISAGYLEIKDTLLGLSEITAEDLINLKHYIDAFDKRRHRLFGFLFNMSEVRSLNTKFRNTFPQFKYDKPHKHVEEVRKVWNILSAIDNIKKLCKVEYYLNCDMVKFIQKAIANDEITRQLRIMAEVSEKIELLHKALDKYPKLLSKLNISRMELGHIIDNDLTRMPDADFMRFIEFIKLSADINSNFSKVPNVNYAENIKSIEEHVTTQMTYILDGRLIEFFEYNKATAKTLRDIIKTKQRFPKEEFIKLKEAFPCILAGIRDYAEYIPLEPELFDLVIIDEASQVSIAQAFPALLRAKKILILGDKKQFSNVKSAQARTDTNREYLNSLSDCFAKNVATENEKRIRLNKFNIKTSILEFFEFISNYNTQLLKHFRGYKEIISYSNRFFYNDSLQVMKIRGKAIDDVLKFTIVEDDGTVSLYQNSNEAEAKFIINELVALKENNAKPSVGIITPHTNQQKLLVEMINKHKYNDFFYDDLKLKIMTFDTCQGEERDIIFYSMVASSASDRLWGIFIKDLKSVDIEEDGQIKAQRLNVGFSRAKECMHFVLSKSVDDFNGSIGEALRHYAVIRDEAKKEKSISETDSKSKMEPVVLNWFYQTEFWSRNKDRVEFIPQFELGKYLKQLDRLYNHPNYKVDFLLIYRNTDGKEQKIIIEYDGFKEHFVEWEQVDESNFEEYYSDEDVYREKVLESYGYEFIRINKFNIGKNPVQALNDRIDAAVFHKKKDNKLIDQIHATATGLQNGGMKECPKCHNIKELEEYQDNSLISGVGRICKACKGRVRVKADVLHTKVAKITPQISNNVKCPRCTSPMILRTGKRGKFYGCSRFPHCRGTRPVH